MKLQIAILLLVFLLSPFSVFSQNDSGDNSEKPEMCVFYDSQIGNLSAKNNAPSWNPEKDEALPLTPHKAFEKGWENLKNAAPTADKKWIVNEINLAHTGNHRWIYTIKFYCFQEGCNPAVNRFLTLINLDGTTFKSKLDSTNWNISSKNFEKRIDYIFSFSGKQYRTKTNLENLMGTPSWNIETEDDAPFSVEKAIEIGREKLKDIIPTANHKWGVTEIILRHLGNNKWVYGIDFDCYSKECDFESDFFQIFIKMDGTFISPIK